MIKMLAKKLVIGTSLASVLFGKAETISVSSTVTWNYRDRYYAQECIVSNIYKDEERQIDLIQVKNCNDFLYYFPSDAGDWSEGDYVAVIMDSKGTIYVMDDEIVSAKYDRPDLLDDLT